MNYTVYDYRIMCGFKEIEKGRREVKYIRRRSMEIAAERNKPARLQIYNFYLRQWDFIGEAYPNGDFYADCGDGPFVLDEKGDKFHKKGEK